VVPKSSRYQGDADAQEKVGYAFEMGRGVPMNYAEALKWYRKAADQGLYVGRKYLASMYESGKGVPQDFVQAYMWYNLAAARGGYAVKERDYVARRMTPPPRSPRRSVSRFSGSRRNRPAGR
jgi:uncharacterized protein